MGTYSRGTYVTLPTDDADLSNVMTAGEISDVATINNVFVGQNLSAQIAAMMFKNTCSASLANLVFVGQSDRAPSLSPITLEAYNYSTAAWVGQATNAAAATNATCTLAASIGATQYLSPGGYTTSRVYQAATGGIQLGADLMASLDGNMEDTESPPTTYWPVVGTNSTVTKNTTDPINGSRDLSIVSTDNVSGARSSYITVTAGKWYRLGCTLKVPASSGSASVQLHDDTVTVAFCASGEYLCTSPTNFRASGICRNTSSNGRFIITEASASGTFYTDDVYLKEITKSSLFTQQVDEGSANVTVSATVTCPLAYASPAGVAICMDANDPTKYILGVVNQLNGYLNYIQVYLVNGTSVNPIVSQAIGGGATYGAGKVLQLVNNTNSLTVNYDGQQQATGVDTTGFTGTICAVFNSDDANTLASFTHTTP